MNRLLNRAKENKTFRHKLIANLNSFKMSFIQNSKSDIWLNITSTEVISETALEVSGYFLLFHPSKKFPFEVVIKKISGQFKVVSTNADPFLLSVLETMIDTKKFTNFIEIRLLAP